jgi:hypothetical protein
VDLIQQERLNQLDSKFSLNPQLMSEAEGIEYVKLLAVARATVNKPSKKVSEPRGKKSSAPAVKISAADFLAKLKAGG